jgi:mRNA interferase MazF
VDLVTKIERLPRRSDVWLVALDPTQGSEIRKTRPCLLVSPDEMNRYLGAIIVAPLTSTLRAYPTRVTLRFQRKLGQVALDQIRTIDKSRLIRRLGQIPEATAGQVSAVLVEMFREA